MTFVFPVLLGGLLLAGVPILLHLIMRQKPKTLSFPAFRFLVQRQRTNLRKLQLRHLLLMALRVLLIVLLCLALGRPRLFNQGLNLNSERPVAAVMVFDTSMSMEYRTSDKLSRLEEAKKRGQEFVSELPAGSRVVVLDTADAVLSVRGDWLQAMSQAQERIKDLKLAPGSVPALQTLEHAYRILGELARNREDETRRFLPRFVCVISDRTRACWDLSKLSAAQAAHDQVPPSLEGMQQTREKIAPLSSLLGELRAKLPPPSGRDYPEQAVIDALEQLAPRLSTLTKVDFPIDDKLSALVETIQRRGRELVKLLEPKEDKDNPQGPFRQKLLVNLQGVLRDLSGAQGLFVDVGIDKPVDLAITHLELPEANGQPRQVFSPGEKFVLRAIVQATGKDMNTTLLCKIPQKTYQQPVEVKANERATIRFEIDCADLKLGPGVHQAEVRFDPPDLLPFNNSRFVSFTIREPPRVLVLTNDVARAEDFKRSLQVNRFAVEVRPVRDLPNIDMRQFQAVYLFAVPDPNKQLWSFLSGFVQQGVGLGIIPGGEEMDPGSYNQEAAQKLMPGTLVRTIHHGKDDGKSRGAVWNLDNDTVFHHPIMRPFRAWKDSDVVKELREAFTFWEVKPLDETVAVVNYQDEKKHPALLERRLTSEKGKPGKVLLFTTPMDVRSPRWNNYLESRNSTYVVLAGLATNYLTGETEAPRLNFISGQDDPVVALPPFASFPFYALKGPNLLEQISPPEKTNLLKLRGADAAGNYLLEGLSQDPAVHQPVAGFSVNVPSEESDLTRVAVREIESLFGPDAVIPVDRKADIRSVLKNHWNEPLELFPLFMVLLLVILAAENLLANKFYRRDNNKE